MKRFNFLAAVFAALVLTFGIYSCGKEESKSETELKNLVLESRVSSGNCNPESIYTDLSECESNEKVTTISFALGNTLYCTCSELYNLCPGLTVDVSYTYTTCYDDEKNPINFVHDLDFDIEAIKAACPAFAEKLAQQLLTNNHVSFLNTIESDISKQIEFSEAYQEILSNTQKYDCESGNAVYSIKFIQNTCYSWGFGESDGGVFFFTKEDCGESVCCSRSGDYCYGGEGSPIVLNGSHEYNTMAFGECPEECTNECGTPSPPGDTGIDLY